MHPIVEAKKPDIIELCRTYGVVKLDLFGSATGPEWNPETSDFDFVVAFDSYGPGIATRLVGFCETLEALLALERLFELLGETMKRALSNQPDLQPFATMLADITLPGFGGALAAARSFLRLRSGPALPSSG